jgi:pyruvate kinase
MLDGAAVQQRPGTYVGIMLDTKGPEVRSWDLSEPIDMKRGERYTFTIQVRPGRAADDETVETDKTDDAQDADDDTDGDLTDDDAADAATVPFGEARIRRAA